MGVVRGIVLHSTASGKPGNPTEGPGTLNYVLTPGTTSYNFLIDRDGTIYEVVPPGIAAWHAQELNYNWLSIAFAHAVESDPLTDAQHESAAYLVAKMCAQYEIPRARVVWLSGPDAGRGVTQHRDTAQGARWGKVDVGKMLRWGQVLST